MKMKSIVMNRIDPVFPSNKKSQNKTETMVICAQGEYNAFLLSKMRVQVKQLKLLVGYPGYFRPPVPTVWFRNTQRSSKYTANGYAVSKQTENGIIVRVTIADIVDEIPSLTINNDILGWEASIDGVHYSPVEQIPAQGFSIYPKEHCVLPLMQIKEHPGVYDVGREVLANLSFVSKEKPHFVVGESIHEVLHVTPENQEQSFETEYLEGQGTWSTPLPLAFRYIRMVDETNVPPNVFALYSPLSYVKQYDFHDEELNRIWEVSAYTLRLCILNFQIDGIKRDRLPWCGDLMISLLANAYSFHEADPIRRTLALLGRDGTQYGPINGILDYSLWFIISHENYQVHFNDLLFLRESYPMILQTLDWFIVRTQKDGGIFMAKPERIENNVKIQEEWLFIDWVKEPKETALNMLLVWALRDGAKLATRVGDEDSAKRYNAFAEILTIRIRKEAFIPGIGLYRGNLFNKESEPTRHANFLAILAEVSNVENCHAIAKALIDNDLPPVGTPYMVSLELMALHKLGYTKEAIQKLRSVWGGMLKLGATTFFEGYENQFNEESMCLFYDRPFGMSLCHAWSSAPCALLPMFIK